jgi:hypothetical protein
MNSPLEDREVRLRGLHRSHHGSTNDHEHRTVDSSVARIL